MKARRCWRYTCDFCRKGGCSKSAIAAHEARCFANPNRRCTMCDAQWPRPELLELLIGVTLENQEEKLKDVEEAAEYCPACVLSATKQVTPQPMATIAKYLPGDDCGDPSGQMEVPIYFDYDYKTKAREYLDEKRREENSHLF